MTAADESAADADRHRCAVPELDAGESWTCPEPDCKATYGQQFPGLPAGTEPMNVGSLLHEVAEACIEAGHSFAAGVVPRVTQNAFYRLGGQLERAARAFRHVDVAVPVERPE